MVLAKFYIHWEYTMEVSREEDLEKWSAKPWDMVSLVISWGEILGIWHSITTVQRINTTAASINE